MVLTVKLFASLRNGRFEVSQLERPPGTTLASLVEELRIAPAEIGILLVNGRHAELTDVPSTGQTVSIFPLVGGG